MACTQSCSLQYGHESRPPPSKPHPQDGGGARHPAPINNCDTLVSPSATLASGSSCYTDVTGSDGVTYSLALATSAPPAEQVTECGGGGGSGSNTSTCQPWPVYFQNQCTFTVWLGVLGEADDGDGQTAGYCLNGIKAPGEWCTRAWFELPAGSSSSIIDTRNR